MTNDDSDSFFTTISLRAPPNLSRCIESRALGEGERTTQYAFFFFALGNPIALLSIKTRVAKGMILAHLQTEEGGEKRELSIIWARAANPLELASHLSLLTRRIFLHPASQPARQSAMSCFPCRGQQQFPRVINDNVGF